MNLVQSEESKAPVREIETEKQELSEESDVISQKLEELRDIIDQVKVSGRIPPFFPPKSHLFFCLFFFLLSFSLLCNSL